MTRPTARKMKLRRTQIFLMAHAMRANFDNATAVRMLIRIIYDTMSVESICLVSFGGLIGVGLGYAPANPGSGRLPLRKKIPASVEFWHFGGGDPESFDFVRDIREGSGSRSGLRTECLLDWKKPKRKARREPLIYS